MSLRAKLTLYYTAVLAITLLLFGLALYLVMGGYLRRETDRELNSRAREIIASIRIINHPLALQRIILPDVDAFSAPGLYLQLVDPQGVILARSRNLGLQNLPVDQGGLRQANGESGAFQTVAVGREHLRLYNVPLRFGRKIIGYLQVGTSLRLQSTVLGGLRLLLVVLALLMVAVAASLGHLLARTALRPIHHLTKVAELIEESADLSQRVPYKGPPDEVGRLAATFNSMLERLQQAYRQLEQAYDAQKRFVADASHELRTPLTTIRGNVELLQHAEDIDESIRREILADLTSESERMSRLLNNLLTLARADAGRTFELSQLPLEELVSDIARKAPHLGPALFYMKSPEDLKGVEVAAHPDYLQELLFILLDNAFRYTPADGEVTLAVRRRPGWIGLAVDDNGPGINQKDLTHIFERFYQANPARSGEGSGLGLSIAQWITKQHQAELQVESEPGRGSTFTVWLPIVDNQSLSQITPSH